MLWLVVLQTVSYFGCGPERRLVLRAVLHITYARGRAIGKAIDFPDIGVRTGSIFILFVRESAPIFKILV